jgi:hypothetical protein
VLDMILINGNLATDFTQTTIAYSTELKGDAFWVTSRLSRLAWKYLSHIPCL